MKKTLSSFEVLVKASDGNVYQAVLSDKQRAVIKHSFTTEPLKVLERPINDIYFSKTP